MRARDNPFASERVLRLRYRLDETQWSGLLARFAGLGHRAALVGPEGSGKTTLQEDIEARLVARGWRIRRLRATRDRRPDAAELAAATGGLVASDLLSIDGAEQFGWWRWRRLCRASGGAGGMLITSHRPGRMPTLREHRTDPALLRSLVAELLDAEAARHLETRCEELFSKHRGNLRECLRALYDDWAAGGVG